MSLYNAIFGQNPASDVLLATLGLTRGDVGRFRDCYIDDGKIAVYTRNGGGNRDHYDDDVEAGESCHCTGCTIQYHLPQHHLYLYDSNDDYDCTYATIYFSFPPEFAEQLKQMDAGVAITPNDKWIAFLDTLNKSTDEVKTIYASTPACEPSGVDRGK